MINMVRTSLQALSTLFFLENQGSRSVFHKATTFEYLRWLIATAARSVWVRP